MRTNANSSSKIISPAQGNTLRKGVGSAAIKTSKSNAAMGNSPQTVTHSFLTPEYTEKTLIELTAQELRVIAALRGQLPDLQTVAMPGASSAFAQSYNCHIQRPAKLSKGEVKAQWAAELMHNAAGISKYITL